MRRREQLDEAAAFLECHGWRAVTKLLRGDPADVLVDAANDADLAVVGGRRLTCFARLMLGSVSSKLVDGADCDVLVVR
jgi:nucleotide-binding universal stress UspA family protein